MDGSSEAAASAPAPTRNSAASCRLSACRPAPFVLVVMFFRLPLTVPFAPAPQLEPLDLAGRGLGQARDKTRSSADTCRAPVRSLTCCLSSSASAAEPRTPGLVTTYALGFTRFWSSVAPTTAASSTASDASQRRLHLERRHVDAAHLEHVVGAAGVGVMAVGIDGVLVAARESRRRRTSHASWPGCSSSRIARGRPADLQLADLALGPTCGPLRPRRASRSRAPACRSCRSARRPDGSTERRAASRSSRCRRARRCRNARSSACRYGREALRPPKCRRATQPHRARQVRAREHAPRTGSARRRRPSVAAPSGA